MKKETNMLDVHKSRLLNKLVTEFNVEDFEIVNKALHSASIKNGKFVTDTIYNVIRENGFIIINGEKNEILEPKREFKITYSEEIKPEESTQESYTVDIFVETEKEILLIDPKGKAHNNNIPVSDQAKKFCLAKKEVQSWNEDKPVRFILLKPQDVDEYQFNRLKTDFAVSGIEFYKDEDFLKEFTGQHISLKEASKENLLRHYQENSNGIMTHF